MAQPDVIGTAPEDWPPLKPWRLLLGGGGAVLVAVLLMQLAPTVAGVILLLAGLIAVGGAVALAPRRPSLVAAAGLVALVGALGMPAEWDSARLVVWILAGIAWFAALLLALPGLIGHLLVRFSGTPGETGKRNDQLLQRGQAIGRGISRGIVSLLVIAHFSGISSAVLSVSPPGRDASWLAQGVWTLLQPYLQFSYLVNAYRFYSPEPGPPSLLWFHIEYADGTTRWLRIPNREEHRPDPMGQEYTRRLSIAEGANQPAQMQMISDGIRQRRISAGRTHNIPILNFYQMDHQDLPAFEGQYRAPTDMSKRHIADYARHVAQYYPSAKNPDLAVTGVKVYRVIHRILDPREMADPDLDPTDPWTYLPYYQGEFTADGVMKDPNDPFLYWLIPIYREPRGPNFDLKNPAAPPAPSPGGFVTRNCLETHAGIKTKPGGQ